MKNIIMELTENKMETPKQIILNEINNTQGWVTKGFVYDISEQEGISPETGARYARELAEEGKILVSYYKSKKNKDLARYAKLGEAKPKPKPKPHKPVLKEIERDGQRIMTYA